MTDNTVPQKTTQAENTEPKFTPGPWRVDIASDNLFSILSPEDGYNEICVLWKYAGAIEDPLLNDAHNAHLIAAAPDLYEALKGILDHETRRRENVTAHLTIENMQARNQLIEEKATVFRNACSALLKARGGK